MPANSDHNSDHRRALALLADAPDGATEAILWARGLTVEMLAGLIDAGFATALAERVRAGGHEIEVVRVRITAAGRRALAKRG